jgi:hypothetical protein
VDKTFFKYFNISCPIKKIVTESVDKYIEKIKGEAERFFDYLSELKPKRKS